MIKKVILITGASSGMGKVTAQDLINQGHTVYCAARRVEKMKDLETSGGKILKMDVTKEEDLQNAVNTIISNEKKIDVLWNNAGFGLFGAVEDVTMEDAKYQMDVNLFSIARLIQLFLPHMRSQKSGLIINTSSIGGKVHTPLGAWYHASKHALEGLSDCLRFEVKQFGIDVVVIEPGAIYTEFPEVMTGEVNKTPDDSAYKIIKDGLIKAQDRINNPKSASPASVISTTVQKIISTKKPKTRYIVGKTARPLYYMRKWCGDRLYDKILGSMIK